MQAYSEAQEIGVHAMWQLQAQRSKLCKDYLDRWTQAGLDGILCKCNCMSLKHGTGLLTLIGPTTPFASVEHGKFRHVGYTVCSSDCKIGRAVTDLVKGRVQHP
jgi:amidase